MGRRRLERHERPNGAGRAGPGTRLQPSTGEDETDDDGRGVEVGGGLQARLDHDLRPQRDDDAVAPRGGRADGHEGVHGHGAVPGGAARHTQESAACPDLDEGRRDECQAVDRLHSQAQSRADGHERHDPDGHRDGHPGLDAQLPLFRGALQVPIPNRGSSHRSDFGARPDVVARRLDRLDQLASTRNGGIHGHRGALRGEVDARVQNAIRLLQVPLDAIDAGGAGHALDVEHDFDRLRRQHRRCGGCDGL